MSKQLIPTLLSLSLATSWSIITPVRTIAASPQVNITDRIVLIKTRSGQGSGVIIKHVGNIYTILTAAHVVNDLHNSPLAITTPDRQEHSTNPREVKIAPNLLDLATISFQSNRNYLVAELGNSHTVVKGQPVFAAGFHGTSLKFYPGTVVAISHQSQELGYGLAIGNADILPGMSGGGLFDRAGNLIGINGKSIGMIDPTANQSNRGNSLKPVSGLAIPIDTFMQIASQLNVSIQDRSQVPVAAVPTADDFFISAGTKSRQGNYQGAIADYDRALAINPQFREVYFRRGIAHSLIGHWQAAEIDYTQSIALNPEYAEAYLHRGNVRNILTNWRGAKSDFDFALSLNPKLLAAYIGRGVALCELNDCQDALNDYARAIYLSPVSADAYSYKGFAHYRLGNRQSAISSYLTAADLYQKQGKDNEYLEMVAKIRQLVRL
jgi:S1-C subfamily serine protease